MDIEQEVPGTGAHGHSHGEDSGGLSRRGFLTAVGAAAGASVVPVGGLRSASASGVSLTGTAAVRAAMHVHASWSEGVGSWESQFARAEEAAMDVMFMTEHDFRSLASTYLTTLDKAAHVTSSSGAARRRAATANGGVWHLLVESSGAAPATTSMAVDPDKTAVNHLRTSIAGHTLSHTFGPSSLSPGARYEVAVTLSVHPASGSRPAGQLELHYRFEPGGGTARGLEAGGLVGVVVNPLPPAGTTFTIALEADVASLWSDFPAMDNALFGLSFTVSSSSAGATADISIQQLRFNRTQSDEASVIRNQQSIIDTYGPRHPALVVRPCVEVSKLEPHLNAFLLPQFMPAQASFTPKNLDTAYTDLVRSVHVRGGLVSLNHPYGPQTGPALGAAAAATKRRSVFRSLWPVDAFGVDVIEAGYTMRGQVGTQGHLDLWDTFSRRGRFLTGNGANDDHSGQPWKRLNNGFFTGVWAASSSDAALTAALAGGRAFSAHLGLFPACQIDMLVDGAVAMGKASISKKASRSLLLYVDGLPAGATVDIVQGVVDRKGEDPLTAVVATLPASAFAGSGTVTRSIDTTSPCFVRAQVRDNHRRIIGFGNPVWLLRTAPPGGVPPARRP